MNHDEKPEKNDPFDGCDILVVITDRLRNNPIDARTIEELENLIEKKYLQKIKVGRALECINYYYRIIRIEDDKLFLSTLNKRTGMHGATEIVTKESLIDDLRAKKIHLLERPPKGTKDLLRYNDGGIR